MIIHLIYIYMWLHHISFDSRTVANAGPLFRPTTTSAVCAAGDGSVRRRTRPRARCGRPGDAPGCVSPMGHFWFCWNETFDVQEVYGSIILSSYYHIFWCFTNFFQYGYNRPAHIAEYVFLKEQHIVESHCLYIVYIDRIIHISSRYFMISLHFCNIESPQTIRLKMVSKRAEHWTWNWK